MARSIARPGPSFSPNAAPSMAVRPATPKSPEGYRLPARHVIHAVGPVWNGGHRGEDEALASCYARAIELCQNHGLASIAFPAISTGVYRFPADRAANIAVATTVDALAAAPAVEPCRLLLLFAATAPGCMNRHWPPSAALVPIDAAATLLGEFREGVPMNSRQLLGALACGALMLVATPPVRAEGTFDIPAGAHFNQARLEKVTEFFKNEVATGKIAGANVLIRQRGKDVYHETFGVQDVVSKTPITDKTIFRLSSLTKAITSVVAMQLIQDGKINLDDPVSKYIPSFANTKVGVEKKAEDGTKTLELVPLTRPITVLDLMRHTSGITYGFYGDSLVRKAYKEANIYAGDFDLAEFAERIAKLPLHNQPGALWQYGHSTDILARIMEIVSGKSLLEIEREKLLDPLGMTDTGFFVTEPEKQKLLAQPVPNDSDFRVGRQYRTEVRQKWESASGGMVTTMSDFSRFAQMLLNGGTLRGQDLSQPEDVRTDGIGPYRQGLRCRAGLFLFPRRRLRHGAGACRAHRSRQRQATAAGIAGRTEMGRRQRLLHGDRPQAGHALRAA